MRKKIVAGNWKMNKTLGDSEELTLEIMEGVHIESPIVVILAPPTPFLHRVKALAFEHKAIKVSAQNCHEKESGAFTGEISVEMLRSRHQNKIRRNDFIRLMEVLHKSMLRVGADITEDDRASGIINSLPVAVHALAV